MKSTFWIIAFLSLPVIGTAQQTKKNPVIFQCSCSDAIGRVFATSMRDAIASSPRYRLVENTPENRKLSFEIDTISEPDYVDSNGDATRIGISIVFLLDNHFLANGIQFCEMKNVDTCVKSAISGFDERLEIIKSNGH